MYSFIVKIAIQYGSKILIGVVAFLLVTGLYFHWKNQVFKAGYEKATAEWMKRETEINRQQTELLKLKQYEYNTALQKNTDMYTGALKHYVENNQDLERQLTDSSNKRLFLHAKCSEGSRNPVPAGSEIPGRNTERGEGVDETELGKEDTRAVFGTIKDVNKMALVCRQALDFIEQNNLVK